ncbi:sigma factor-like helix-turn-helix DNA-binding protein [Flexivirga caeni]|uniref:RNA polymerase sigma factor 70 region 4 type 2 domain-containing protein n=1 Tax=Flexivirga caeni TaxID=2294115 RepID=A0A3M9MGL1_9MICO|nr:sigma factor-like helix-turn-helix DNA-binding protein [Flexivirga caeni]RNI24297.1 hypothetical protein EFY87_04840 [Flexivirga caeni]
MRGNVGEDLADFVAARTAELHRTAYLLAGDQDDAERLVARAVGQLARDTADVGQAGQHARQSMARLAVAGTAPTVGGDTPDTAPVLRLSPRQRAILMLRHLDGLTVRMTARQLGIPRREIQRDEETACATMGFAVDDHRIGEMLTNLGEHAAWPDPAVTIERSRHAPASRLISRTRVAAAIGVAAVTIAAVTVSNAAHDSWLRSPAGINATHGTHFHAYTQGYKLVGVQTVTVGATRTINDLAPGGVLALSCARPDPRVPANWPQITDGTDVPQPYPCAAQSDRRYYLYAPDGVTSVTAPRQGHQEIAVARYVPVPWDRYPVAKSHFDVQHNVPLDLNAKANFGDSPVRVGETLTMHGTNGTFTGTARVPPSAASTTLFMSGLLSPTTTGQYRIEVGGSPMSDCSIPGSADDNDSGWCRIYDRWVPQVPMSDLGGPDPDIDTHGGSVVVRVQVRDALGPWKLQIRYDRYKAQN